MLPQARGAGKDFLNASAVRLADHGKMAKYEPKDSGYRRAKKEGYRSRAALKLVEIDDKFGVLRRGRRVVDLGCWPGGWLQVAAERVGPEGRVVGIDLEETDPVEYPNVSILTGDAAAEHERIGESLGSKADVVLSDMAPKLSGIKAADAARHEALVELAVYVAQAVGKTDDPDFCLVAKLFSPTESASTQLLKANFTRVAKYRPPGSRKGSSELYAVARAPR